MLFPSSLSQGKQNKVQIKKRCLTVRIGLEEGKFQNLPIPITYLDHYLFKRLLEKAQDVYGYRTKGLLKLPCTIDEFCQLKSLIEREREFALHAYQYVPAVRCL
ncbi:hypothetical protein GIB67_036198 [Kingdonia uniflora]|uniref:Small auxin up regulated protein n=1 Tax=Kingdonia uniflora TaxID=39325 RepID=A0A7J7L4R0_9MAGN|nr:hypothetical protein GIB67_036198 [Kingdonia uniflora]